MSDPIIQADPEADPSIKPSHLAYPVVGLGASAGGLAALERFFSAMPKQPDMAFVVILHLSPKHESIADKILQRATSMPVVQVNASMPLEQNHIYVIPPRKQLAMTDGQLRISEREPGQTLPIAIDYFFRTLAEAHRERAVAIVLSGSGSDGSSGISRVRELGGLTFAQLPSDAEFDGMPSAAIATGAVDIVLPAAEMPDRLLTLANNAQRIELPHAAIERMPVHDVPEADTRQLAEAALHDIMVALRKHTGHDFQHYKRATVLRRIERRMQVNGIATLPAYRDFLQATAAERPALLKDMLISVTNFFRDREAFDALEREVIPEIFARRATPEAARADPIRVWSCGCATGEEAYSLAMLLCERAGKITDPPSMQLFASDIDEDAISAARAASYPMSIVTDIAPSRLEQFFTAEDGRYHARKSLREKVLFARHNVLQDPPFSRLDLIVCRNLLIYLERHVQRRVLEMFHFALRPGGYLFLGSAESTDAAPQLFTAVDKKHRIFRASTTRRGDIHVSTPNAIRSERAVPAATPSRDKRATAVADLHQRVLEQHAPPSVLVNRDGTIMHMTERAGRFLRHGGGTPSLNLLALILPELRRDLRTALYQAVRTGQSVDSRRVEMQRDGKAFYVNMTTRPVLDETSGETYYLVLLTEVEYVLGARSGDPHAGADDPALLQLEEELKRAKDQLQNLAEQSETSHGELVASNEELQSINEELRSATEELETGKEELQSINEELTTVNHELKEKVDETAKVNDDLQNLIASTDIATVFIDRDLRIKRYTPRAADIFRILPADAGRPLLDLTNRLSYPELGADANETLQTLQTSEREVGGAHNTWYIVRMAPYRTAEDRIEGVAITFIDITLRRRAEDAAHENEERMRQVAESALEFSIITMDPGGMITSWNAGAERMFGYTEREAVGQSGALIFTEPDREDGAFEREMERVRTEGRAVDDRWHQRKDGTTIFCSGIVRPLEPDGAKGYAKICRDVTGDRHARKERELLLQAEQEAREAAQAATRQKDEFLAVMSHELKHPLNLILMNAELLARHPHIEQDENTHRATEAIRRTVLNQAQIIDDLLDLSRINTGKLALNLSSVNASECIRRIAAAVRGDLAQRQLEMHCALPPTDIWLTTDPVRLDQIVWNLVSNAMKFTRAGGRIGVQLAIHDGAVQLDVSDNGQGMTEESLERVFDMFQQANLRANRRTGGLGIGLALVRQLAELQGGSVRAYSDGLGHGSRICVRWPVAQQAQASDHAPAATASGVAGRHILLVDDSIEILEPFGALLEMEGAQVTLFDNGAAALEFAREHGFDVLLSDIGMPDMDGYELIRKIRQLPQHARVPAVALTGFGRAEDGERAREAGFDIHIGKPIVLKDLLATLAEVDARPRAG